MKKIFILLVMFLTSFTLIACDGKGGISELTVPELLGGSDVTIEAGLTWTDPGLSNFVDEYEVQGTVDVNTIGEYEISYVVEVDGEVVSVERTIRVVDSVNPVVTINGTDMTINKGDAFVDPGASSMDSFEGDLTSGIVVNGSVDKDTLGEYIITYKSSDSSGNEGRATRTVTVVESTLTSNNAPVITINGESEITILLGSTYTDLGAVARDEEDGLLTSDIVTVSDVDTSVIGTYTITYDVSDSEGKASTRVTRTVHVVENITPVITLIGESVINIYVGDTYTDAGASALDSEDGQITNDIVIVNNVDTNNAGVYTVTYDVSDSEGLAALRVIRTVNVTVNAIPVITLLGEEQMVLMVDDVFTDPGFTASDVEDGDVTSDVIVAGTVNTSVVGVYTITYSYTDNHNNEVSVVRTVTVNSPTDTVPVITLIGDDFIFISMSDGYVDLGVTALDTEDGDLTTSVVTTLSDDYDLTDIGEYTITYTVTDSDSNTVSIVRYISVERTTNVIPELFVDSEDVIRYLTNETYYDPTYSARDFEDGNITGLVSKTRSEGFDSDVPGTYTILYTVTDSDGNTASKTITVIFKNDDEAPVVELVGFEKMYLIQHSVYTEEGVNAIDAEDGDISDSVVITGSVDVDVLGVYVLTYTITDSNGVEVVLHREITVVNELDTAPVLTLNDEESYQINQGVTYVEPGYSAWDDQDGDVTDNVIVLGLDLLDTSVPGGYWITYKITDSDYNSYEIARAITVVAFDNDIPTIALWGDAIVMMRQGAIYNEDGAAAHDPQDGTISDQVEIDGLVDVTTPGKYVLTYTITDLNGASASVTRDVYVIYNKVPKINLIGDDTVFVNVFDSWVDPGVTASDYEDGPLTSKVVVDSDIDFDMPGEYTVRYSVRDTNGKTGYAYRTVVVVNNIAGDYGTVVIEKDLDLDFNDVLLSLDFINYTGAITEVDTSVVGDTFLVLGGYGVLFKVFENSFDDISVTPGTIFYTPGYDSLNVRVKLYEQQMIGVTGYQDVEYLFDFGLGSGESIISGASNQLFRAEALVEAGVYEAYLRINGEAEGELTFSIDNNDLVDESIIDIEIDEYTVIYETEKEQVLQFTAPGGELEIVMMNYGVSLLTIKDDSGNIIIQQRMENQFLLKQHFAAGEYEISIDSYSDASTLKILIASDIKDNYGYIFADFVLVGSTNDIKLLPGREWFRFEITEAAYYKYIGFDSSEPYLPVNIYDISFELVDLNYSSIYLEEGRYYLEYDSDFGYTSFTIDVPQEELQSELPLDIIVTSGYSDTFEINDDVTGRWYQFTLDEETVVYFGQTSMGEISPMFIGGSDSGPMSITLYDIIGDGMTLEGEYSDNSYVVLPAGTYRAHAHSTEQGIYGFSFTTYDTEEASTDKYYPTDIVANVPFVGYVEAYVPQYFRLNFCDEGVYEYNYNGESRRFTIDGDGGIVLDTSFWGSAYGYIEMDEGRKTIKLGASTKDSVYTFTVTKLENSATGFSFNAEDAPYLDPYKLQYAFVARENTSVFQKISFEEDTALFTYPENVKSIIVYDDNDNVYLSGEVWDLLPIALESGDYTFEFISDRTGFIFLPEVWTTMMYDYDKPTILDHYHNISGFIGEDKVDMFEFVLEEETLLSVMFWEELDVTILDSDKTMLKDRYYDYEVPMFLEAGTYYIVVNKDSGFYSINLSNLNDQVLPTDSSSAKEVYIHEEFDYYIKDVYSEGYVTFYSDQESIVIYENLNRYDIDVSYIVYDSDMVEMPEGRVGLGTYYIKFYTYGVESYDIDQAVKVNFKIVNINEFVGHNSQATASELENGYTRGYSPWYTKENWYKFSVAENEYVSFKWNVGSTEINYETVDVNGDLFVLEEGLTQYPVGDYFIGIYHNSTERLNMLEPYQFEFNKVLYEDVTDDCTLVDPLDIRSGVINISGYIVSNSDKDCFKLRVSDPYYLTYAMNSSVEVYQIEENGSTLGRIYPYSNNFNNGEEYIYIKVKVNSYYGPSAYDISIQAKTDFFVGSTMETAKQISLEKNYNAIVFSQTEVDYYKLTVYEIVGIEIDGPSTLVFDEFGDPYLSENLLPGTYYFACTPGDIGMYSFRVYDSSEDDEGPGKEDYDYLINTYETPLVLEDEFFVLTEEKTESKSSTDYYQFEVTGIGSLYSVTAKGFNHSINIKDSNNDTVQNFTLFGDERIFYLSAGVYTIGIGDSYEYSIDFAEVEFIRYADNSAHPTEIDLYENIHSYILDPSTLNYFEFTVTEDQVIQFLGGTGEGMFDYDIVDTLGNSMKYSNQSSYMFLTEGTYQVVISGSMEMILVDYEFRIVALHDVITNTVKEDAPLIEIKDEYSWFNFYSDEDDVYAKIVLDRDSFLELPSTLNLEDENGMSVDDDVKIPAGTYIVTYTGGRGYNDYVLRDNTDYKLDGPKMLFENRLYTVFTDDRDEADIFTYTAYNDQLFVLSKMVGDGFYVEVYDVDGHRVSHQNVGPNGVNQHSVNLKGGMEYRFEITGVYGFYQFEYTVYAQENPISVSDLSQIADNEDVVVVGIITAFLPDYGFVMQDPETADSIYVALDLEYASIGTRIVVRGVVETSATEAANRRITDAAFVRTESFNNPIIKSSETDPGVIADAYRDQQSYTASLTIVGFDFEGYVVFEGSNTYDLMFKYTVFAPYMEDVYSIGDVITFDFTVLDLHRSTVRILPTSLPELNSVQKTLAAGGRITFADIVEENLIFASTDTDYGVDFFWTTSNESVISSTGVVTRPAIGQNDVVVTITLESKYGIDASFHSWTVTVPQLRAPIVGTYEEFETFNDTNGAFHDGSFTGVDSLSWEFKGMTAYTDGAYTIGSTGTSLMFGPNTRTRELTTTVSNGISDLSIDLLSGTGIEGAGGRSIEIFINDVSVGEYNLKELNTVESFKIYDIDVSGDCTVRIEASGYYSIVIDNFLWSDYSE